MVLRAGGLAGDSQQALSDLIQAYWYPLYAFSRRRGISHHDAMDLTQGFFAHLLSGNALGSVAPERGRFRSFLIASFKNFMANEHRAGETQRRGGEVSIISLANTDFAARFEREPADKETPELLFERSWVEEILQRVLRRLAQDYERAGRSELFRLLEPYLAFRGDATPRNEIGLQLNLSPAAIAMSIYRMRRRYGELLREEVAATVDDPAEIDDELRSLMAVLQ